MQKARNNTIHKQTTMRLTKFDSARLRLLAAQSGGTHSDIYRTALKELSISRGIEIGIQELVA